MRTALRLAICVVLASTARPVFAQGNGSGDGEANVPFETMKELPVEVKKTATPEELGGGSGEPGAAEARAEKEGAIHEYAEREFLRLVWESP